MKQSFFHKQHKAFKEYFWIKDAAGKWDTVYIEKTRRYIPCISWIPGIKMIGVGNSLSMNSGNKNSDIDLFIVTATHSLWFVRIVTTLVFQLLWVRKTASKHAGRFCLSFFATTNALNFWAFAIENDIYLYFWIVYFKPLYDHWGIYNRFLQENSKWADFSKYTDIIIENKKYIVYNSKSKVKEENLPFPKKVPTGGWIIKSIDSLLKHIFLPKTKKSFQKLWKPFGVIISDNMLKFHDNDIRKQVWDTIIETK